MGNNGSCWHVGRTRISTAYKAFSPEKFTGDLGVYIGLDHANITLDAVPWWDRIVAAAAARSQPNASAPDPSHVGVIDVHFNERRALSYPLKCYAY